METKATDKATDTDEKLIQRAKQRFTASMSEESEQRDEMSRDLKFVRLGGTHQWDDAAVSSRTMVGQERPILTINRIAAFNNQVINEIRQNRPAIKIRPCDDHADVETAEIFQGVIRNIESQSNAGIAYETAAASMVDCGLGYFRIIQQYITSDAWEQELVIKRVHDIFKVVFDPNSSEPDGSDARWAGIMEEIPRDDFDEQYPKESAGWDASGVLDSDWTNKKIVRIFEYFEKKETPEKIHVLIDGRVVWDSDLKEGDEIEDSRKSSKTSIMWYKLGADAVLESTELLITSIPIIPCIGNEVWTDGKRTIYGLTRHGKSPQQLYNYQSSCEAEYLALSPLSPFMASLEAVQGHEKEYKNANRSPASVLFYNAYDDMGRALPKPERQQPAQVPTGIVNAKQAAIDDIKSSLGIYDATLGNNPSEQSGKAVLSLQRQASQGTFHYSANMARSIRQAGRILVEWIPKVYDTARIMRIIGEDDEIDHVKIDPDMDGAKGEIEDERGEIQKIYNLSVGRYDVYADVGASYATKRQESAESMMNLVQSYPDIMQVAGDLIIKNLDWAGSDVISERMKKMLPPQLQEPEKGQQSPDQAAQQAQQQMEQMANQMEHMSQEIARLSDDKDIKILELYIKRFDAETKRIKTIADIEAGTAPGIEPTTLEIEAHVNQMLNDEHARELAINQEIHKQHMDLNPPQPQMQESPQREATESVQEPQAIEQEEAMQ
jgi:hypothetical protein